MTVELLETAAAPSAGYKGARARIRLISEGQGSSGFYPGAVLEQDGPAAFPGGTHLFYNHLGESGHHPVEDLIGVTLSDAVFVQEENALYTEAEFFPHAADFVRSVMPYVGLSIEAHGTKSSEDVVESLRPSPLNAIALVPRAGRDGKITELYESYRESGTLDTKVVENSAVRQTRKDLGMTPEEITSVAEALATALAPAFTKITEALTPVVEEVAIETLDSEEIVEALVASGLPKTGRARVLESVKNGVAVLEAITSEKNYVAEVLKENTAAVGKITESAASAETYTVGGW